MYYYLRHRANGRVVSFKSSCLSELTGEFPSIVHLDIDALIEMYPKSLNEKIDMIMLNLGKEITRWGDTIRAMTDGSAAEILKQSQISCIFMCENLLPKFHTSDKFSSWTRELSGTLEILKELGYLKAQGTSQSDFFTFTASGWKHLGGLQMKNNELPQAFIAMWFDEKGSMNMVRDSIKQAIVDAGYLPVIIDEKEHNNQIVPEIFYEIQNSKFIVADLCGHRNGVYYEAGYARGLGKEVILTCRKSDFGERHFDVAQQSTIVYETDEELYGKLLKRIEVSVGKRRVRV